MLGAERRETTKRRRQSHFCLSFMGALSLSSTNGTGSFLLSVTSSNKLAERSCTGTALIATCITKSTRWCGHRCFKRIKSGDRQGKVVFLFMSKLSFELLYLCYLIPLYLFFSVCFSWHVIYKGKLLTNSSVNGLLSVWWRNKQKKRQLKITGSSNNAHGGCLLL